MPYICKYEVWQSKGGSEEGGWWYDEGEPQWDYCTWIPTEWLAYKVLRYLNDKEYKRREKENHYGYTSVLSYRESFYEYRISDTLIPKHFPEYRPHYE